ncbi:hypothetical protein Q2E61_09140 [Microbulbifer thermotolerans]|uniref:hypothetical protein n=1 Tax=Microbulbifer thermotolerans TaxID=252514 RepID=UPI002670F81D|nr:hypothetical protein [Microbulbifer thermotolerans]WKT59091.1 hypothetical protein Q2E61_09140 [Microbulbifer thermotolerans]
MNIISVSRNEFTVADATPEQIEALVSHLPFYVNVLWTNRSHETVSVICGNKREAAEVRAILEQPVSAPESAAEQPEERPAANRKTVRRPELVLVAEREGLNHGKSWIASDYDVDRLSLNPSWVGEAICYVYE